MQIKHDMPLTDMV